MHGLSLIGNFRAIIENDQSGAFKMKLPAFFSDGMVIGPSARIWGWVTPNEKVIIHFLGKEYNAVADSNGRFEVIVTADGYGGPYTMTINDRVIQDVYVGRLWLCSGQSNMEQPLSRTRPLLDAHIKEDSRIRAFQVEKNHCFDKPAEDVNGKWESASGAFLENLFAVPYFFAKVLLENDSTPIGLLNVAAGGTPIEGWLPEEIIRDFPAHYERLVEVQAPGFIDQLQSDSDIRIQKWHKDLSATDAGLAQKWHSLDYDDSTWGNRMLLDTSGLPDQGAVWYRKKISLPKLDGPVTLYLGRVVDSVKVYVNDQLVCSIDYQYPPCTCVLPNDLLVVGENLIVIRAVSDSNRRSFTPDKSYELVHMGGRIDLNSLWKCNIGCAMPRLEPGTWFYNRPCGVYNYMLAPLLGTIVEGVIWYQGESNTAQPHDYVTLFTAFVNHLRTHFSSISQNPHAKENLPIIFTQLANFVDPFGTTGDNWAMLREQQRKCLTIPNTAMAVAIDCGEWNDLHPQDKKTVGERLALCAQRLAYKKDVIFEGPTATKAIHEDGVLTIYFDNSEGLWAKNGRPMVEIIDLEGDVLTRYAIIKNNALIINVKDILRPLSRVRFGWTDCPTVVLYNAYSLPASPFELHIA